MVALELASVVIERSSSLPSPQGGSSRAPDPSRQLTPLLFLRGECSKTGPFQIPRSPGTQLTPKPGPMSQAKGHEPGPTVFSGAKKIFSFLFLLNSGGKMNLQ